MRSKILFFLIMAIFLTSVSQAESRFAIPASTTDFQGKWMLLPVNESIRPKVLKEDPWPAKCQFFGHYKNGTWLHQQSYIGECKNQIPDSPINFPNNVTWSMLRKGTLIIDRPEHNFKELWKVDKITKNTHLENTNLIEGDLLMQMYSPDMKTLLYVRLLRKVAPHHQ